MEMLNFKIGSYDPPALKPINQPYIDKILPNSDISTLDFIQNEIQTRPVLVFGKKRLDDLFKLNSL
jgi:hypothetical protein